MIFLFSTNYFTSQSSLPSRLLSLLAVPKLSHQNTTHTEFNFSLAPDSGTQYQEQLFFFFFTANLPVCLAAGANENSQPKPNPLLPDSESVIRGPTTTGWPLSTVRKISSSETEIFPAPPGLSRLVFCVKWEMPDAKTSPERFTSFSPPCRDGCSGFFFFSITKFFTAGTITPDVVPPHADSRTCGALLIRFLMQLHTHWIWSAAKEDCGK